MVTGLHALDETKAAPLDAIGALVHEQLLPLASDPRVRDIRHLGGMAALDLVVPEGDGGYLSSRAPTLRRAAIEHGVLLRP